jgi:hypothetical protein
VFDPDKLFQPCLSITVDYYTIRKLRTKKFYNIGPWPSFELSPS